MPIPTILIGILLSSVYGTLFHLWRGGSLRRFFLYLVLAWAGFWAGEFLGWYFGWDIISIGMMNAGVATLVSLLFLFAGDWVSRIEIRRDQE